MKLNTRYLLLFFGAIIVCGYLHEIGHAVAGWIVGVAVAPTLAKEYVLQPELAWNKATWICLGGVVGTTVATLSAVLYFWRKPCPEREAILGGALLPIGLYSLRFALVGRGHDSFEWQAAQTALDLPPAGHAIDIFFLGLLILGFLVWIVCLHPSLRSLLGLAALGIVGIFLLVGLQVGNNAVFDHMFRGVRTLDVPAGLDPR